MRRKRRWPHLPRTPITEAIIDLRVEPRSDLGLAALKALHELVAEEYPKVDATQKVKGTLEMRGGVAFRQELSNEGVIGYFFRSADDRRIFQARRDGFTFNRLEPYTTWEELSAEALRLWGLYLRAASPSRVTRVAIRYINDLRLPFPLSNFADYLKAPPRVPPGLPQVIQSFVTRVVVPDPDRNASTILTLVLEPGARVGRVPLVLDIDVFTTWTGTVDSQDIWNHLEVLRTIKNEAFFGSLTKKAIELYR